MQMHRRLRSLTSKTKKLCNWCEKSLRSVGRRRSGCVGAALDVAFSDSKYVVVYKLTFVSEKVAVKSISVCSDSQNTFERDERLIVVKLIATAQSALSLPRHKQIAQMREFAYIQQTVDNT